MKYIRSGAKIGMLCPMVLVTVLWLIQFVSFVLAPDRGGPDWNGFLFSMALTLGWASPFLLVGAVIGAIAGAIATVFLPGAMPRTGKHERAEQPDATDSR